MDESRLSLNILAGGRPDSATTTQTLTIQLRLDRGREGIVQLIRAVPGTGPVVYGDNPKTLVDKQLLCQFRLSASEPYAEIDTKAGTCAHQLIGVGSFTLVLYGKPGTSVSARMILEE